MKKTEILQNLKNEQREAYASASSNASKAIKAAKQVATWVEKYFNNEKEYFVRETPNGYLNKGDLVEMIINHVYGIEVTHVQTQGSHDLLKKRKFYECKALLNPSNLPYINNIDHMADDDGLLIVTYNGAFKIYVKTLKEHLHEMKIKSDGKIRITCALAKKLGTMDQYVSKALGLI